MFAGTLVQRLSETRAMARLVEALRRGVGAHALHETIPAARPALLAAAYRALGGQLFVIVATPDAAERLFADLLYYLEESEPSAVRLLRAREDLAGAIDSPSERSARMTLLSELVDGGPGIFLAPLVALRQYVVPREEFARARFTLARDRDAGWDATIARLHRLGYRRCDVVSAAGEYAVRGGILDVFPASADKPARLEFFGDAVESIRPFEVESQRSEGSLDALEIAPWTEIPRDAALREDVLRRFEGPQNVLASLRAYLASGADVPEAWLPFAFEQRETVLDYLSAHARIVIDEPGMLATVEEAWTRSVRARSKCWRARPRASWQSTQPKSRKACSRKLPRRIPVCAILRRRSRGMRRSFSPPASKARSPSSGCRPFSRTPCCKCSPRTTSTGKSSYSRRRCANGSPPAIPWCW